MSTPLRTALEATGQKIKLAAACGVRPSSVTVWNKKGWVPGRHARKAAEFLGLSLDDVLEKGAN